MTIHSDWARLLHAECPEAFHEQIPPGDYGVGVIDGHLQLMCLHAGFQTWDTFVAAMFVRPIQQLFEAGCPTVVLCFDSYDHVPIYKSMTQLKRARPHKVCVFGPGQELPPQIPEDTMVYLMNRHFKLKVIQLACARVPQIICQTLLAMAPDHGPLRRRFIIDYKRVVEYSLDDVGSCLATAAFLESHGEAAKFLSSTVSLPLHYSSCDHITPVPVPDLVPLGESDIKFVRYVEKFGNALVHAIDGDYMAIALLYYASCGLRDDNRIFLYRQLSCLHPPPAGSADSTATTAINNTTQRSKTQIKTDEDEDEDAPDHNKKNTTLKKRKRRAPGPPAAATPTTTTAKTTQKKKTPKFWVDMQLLYSVLALGVRQSVRGSNALLPMNLKTQQPFTDGDAVHAAVALMLCAGTDFSRPMPLMGPKRLWEHLPLYAHALLRAAPLHGAMDVPLFENAVIATLYRTIFSKHIATAAVAGAKGQLPDVLRQLRSAKKLSNTTISRLPTLPQVEVTLQNIEWVMAYWRTYNSQMPAPLDGTNGFVRCATTSMIMFADLAPCFPPSS